MKKLNYLPAMLTAVAVSLLTTTLLAQDPVQLDPKHYTVAAENDRARVLRIKYGPGEKSVMHYHPESIVIFLTDFKGSFTLPDGKIMNNEGKSGDVRITPAGKHLPNLGNKGIEAIQVELKPSGIERVTNTAPEIDVTRALVKDYQEGNWSSWLSHYADTAKAFHNSVDGITPAALQEALTGTLKKLSAYHFIDKDNYFERVIDKDGATWVSFWGNWVGTVAATGKEIVVPVHLALKFINNKIVKEHGYYDMSKLINL